MNRHTKVSLFVAPILILLGYVLSDIYLEDQANEKRIFEMSPFGHCDVINEKCVLRSGDFEVNVYDTNGITTVNSTFPLDRATIFLVDGDNRSTAYRLGMKDSPYYWKRETPLRELIANKGAKHKLRLIAEVKGGRYISEFYTQTVK